ncbi:MAG: TetR/AcrR family transcriptional regulator [Leptolyngbyaceae cyanobacterium RM2_2_4]|nr:TetR/AcrR family transcriptional regulator [Leptolyngbyaceae cyanobacterium SM1_4_3]NJN89020.1 TetR/AcrR family transcriptional regulator [Leptolyngbyaceae cyanobacterium SL_5_14]NJO51007.1 TetR/AcrR family transcriptional regulator [Leptolyngbyaceae cyanobacterium RM2_2_4]
MLSNQSTNDIETSCKPEQILQGAFQVFLQHGYAGTSMDRVATEAGVSKHTIYNHFQGKEGLFIALIERLVLRHFQVEFGCVLPETAPPEKVLRRFAEILLARMDDPEYIAFVRLMIAESGRFPDLAQLYVREVIQRGTEVLGNYLKSRPDLNVPDPAMTCRVFFGSLISFILSQEVLHGKLIMPVSKERLIYYLVDLVLSYHKQIQA